MKNARLRPNSGSPTYYRIIEIKRCPREENPNALPEGKTPVCRETGDRESVRLHSSPSPVTSVTSTLRNAKTKKERNAF
uniref:Uncharacterized protein n=1 Tax=Anguilla anguilla TaxID=7936 RepID=A0A0E9UMI2_ANGAN